MKVNFLYEYKKYSGKENMEIDSDILNYAINKDKDELYIRFYGWEPKCVSLGRNQKEFTPPVEIDVVRRPTGGRALLHDKEITYLVAGKIPEGQKIIDTYRMISNVLIDAFKTFNINLEYSNERGGCEKYCMNISSGADVCYMGKKLIGSAQFRSRGYFLQHGSILKEIDYPYFEKVFNEPLHKDKITSLNEIAPVIDEIEIISSIKKSFLKLN